jgi:uncharacterized protein (DUF362 family)
MTTARLLPEEMLLRDRRRSRVAIISAERYSERLDDVLLSGLREFRLNLRGKSVLLKPNLVEYIAGVEVNTKPVLVGAAAEAFLKLGAKSVVAGEGTGHQRDTYLVLDESGLADQLHSQKISFVDLNRDELVKVPEGHLHGSGACGCPGLSSKPLCGVDAKDQDPSLGCAR